LYFQIQTIFISELLKIEHFLNQGPGKMEKKVHQNPMTHRKETQGRNKWAGIAGRPSGGAP
jgi:hypothetical protein